jgi:hypothetical protein
VIVHEEHYYALKPFKNDLYCLLEDLKHYRGITLRNLNEEITKRHIASAIPLQLS